MAVSPRYVLPLDMLPLLETRWGRRLLFAALYFSEGAPIGFVWVALPTHLAAEGADVDQITWLTSLLVLPWALKFLWAPLVDVLQGKRWSLRKWIIAAQAVMLLTLYPVAGLNPLQHSGLLLGMLLCHAVAAATQDVAIDALCIRTTPASERGSINGWMQLGMLAGRACLGGGAVILAQHWGWRFTVGCVMAAVALPWVLVICTREPSNAASDAKLGEGIGSFGRTLLAALRVPATWIGLVFALVAGAVFEGVGAVIGPYLISRRFLAEHVGFFQFLPVIAAMTLGSLAGGWLADRLGKKRVAAGALVGMIVAVCLLAGFDARTQANPGWIALVLLTAMYLGVGLFNAATYALFMDITSPRIAATQFSTFLGATNACEAWAGRVASASVIAAGYPFAFGLLAAISAAMLPWLLLLRVPPDVASSPRASEPPK